METIKIQNSKLILKFLEAGEYKGNLQDLRYKKVWSKTQEYYNLSSTIHEPVFYFEKSSEIYLSSRKITECEGYRILEAWGTLSKSGIKYRNLLEILAIGTEKKEIIELTQKRYTQSHLKKMRDLSESVISQKTFNSLEDTTPKYIYKDRYKTYSVCQLMGDLVKYECSLHLDSRLIGHYNRLTSSYEKSDEIEYSKNSLKIRKIQGNSAIPNESLYYTGTVKIKGDKEVPYSAMLCVIRDGYYNLDYLAVNCPKPLFKKFKRLGIIVQELLYEGDCVLDLKRLPVYCRFDLRQTNLVVLADAIQKHTILKSKIRYLKNLSTTTTENPILGRYNKVQTHISQQAERVQTRVSNIGFEKIESILTEELKLNSPEELLKKYQEKKSNLEVIINRIKRNYILKNLPTEHISIYSKELKTSGYLSWKK